MVKRISKMFFPLLALTLVASCAETRKTGTRAAATPLDHLPALKGDYFRFESKAVGRPFHIYVRYPEDYAEHPAKRYPAVYLLDGDSLFPMIAPTHLFLQYDEALPEALIVGIAYGSFDPAVNRRNVDFGVPGDGVPAGERGAPAFQNFLKRELMPQIERRYRADPDRRVLFGQSRGGSFVLYSAFTEPDLFWGRIASNPAFDPGRAFFFGKPAAANRPGLSLVVTSGSRDRPRLRDAALAWFRAWDGRTGTPWALKTLTIEGGTHAADGANAYRAGMLWLFRKPVAATGPRGRMPQNPGKKGYSFTQ